MAKRTGSIHLEEKIWDFIDTFKEDNKISSRSTAIEWIILSFMIGKDKGTNFEVNSNIQIPDENENISEKTDMDAAIDNIEDDMPE